MRWPFRVALVAALIVLAAHPAGAEIIEDFSGAGIDAAKWRVIDASGLGGQHDGRFHFEGRSKGEARLVSKETMRPGFFTLRFGDFNSLNNSLSGMKEGSFVCLGLAVGRSYVRIIRGDVRGGSYVEVNSTLEGGLEVSAMNVTHAEGQLGLSYDGHELKFYFNPLLSHRVS